MTGDPVPKADARTFLLQVGLRGRTTQGIETAALPTPA